MEHNGAPQLPPIFFERAKLYEDTVACRRTDKVLAAPLISQLPIRLYGETTVQDTMLNYGACESSFVRYHQEFQPDLCYGPQSMFPTGPLEVLDCQYIRYPGKHLTDPNASFQVVDREDGYMSADEYLEYAEDPTGFFLRKVLPRHHAALKGLEMLDFSNAIWQGALYGMIPAAMPPVKQAFDAMSKAGAIMLDTAQAGGKICGMLAGMGWPSANDMSGFAPFDLFNDTLRGFLNTTMDMIECPEELLAALETSTKQQVRSIKHTFATQPFCKTYTFFLHNGFDMFMSREQWQTFYWPGLKACVEAVVACGGIPHIYIEDKMDSKLDILANELPAGKCIVTLINCDMQKAKELFAGKICISGGIDGTLLQYGTPEDVIKKVKASIDLLAPGGGFFLNADTSLDVAKPENLHAMFETARTYMKY